MKSTFIEDMKETIISRLSEYEGMTTHGCDLAYMLFERENIDGSVLCNTFKTKEFIKENFDLFGDLIEYCSEMGLEIPNPFLEPEKAHIVLILEASKSILSKLSIIDIKWNEEITINQETIKQITNELKALDIDEEDLF